MIKTINISKKWIYLICFVFGGIANLALPPFGYTIFMPISICCFYIILYCYNKQYISSLKTELCSAEINITRSKYSFILGISYGFGYFLFGIYWIYNAFTVMHSHLLWLAPICVILLSFILSLFLSITGFLYGTLSPIFLNRNKFLELILSPLLFSVAWVLGEYLRSTLFTGFPWNLAIYSIYPYEFLKLPLLEINIYIYSSILLLIILFLTHILILLLYKYFLKQYTILLPLENPRYNKIFSYIIFVIVIVSIAHYIFQYLQMEFNHNPQTLNEKIQDIQDNQSDLNHEELDNVIVRVIQPNIPRNDKFNPAKFDKNLEIYSSLIFDNIDLNKQYIILLPEAAMVSQTYFSLIHKLPSNTNIHLIVGTLLDDHMSSGVYNSLISAKNKGKGIVTEVYNKMHLVPFGEYIPFPLTNILSSLSMNIKAGNGYNIFPSHSNVHILPLICYEAIFPNHISSIENMDKILKPDTPTSQKFLLANATNDIWFGNFAGPQQHLIISSFRAVEYGIPMIRSVNNGISALIDNRGNIVKRIELFERGYIEIPLIRLYQE